MAEGEREFLLEVMRQYREQLRLIQTERLGFLNTYAVIVAGVLAFLSQAKNVDSRSLFIVLSVLSVLGLLWSIRNQSEIAAYHAKMRELASRAGVPPDLVAFFGATDWTRFIRLRVLFIALYAVATIVFASLAITSPNYR